MPNARIAALLGDYYHEPGPMMDALRASTMETGVLIEFFQDPSSLPWGKLSDYGALVIAREGRIAPNQHGALWSTKQHENAIAAFVRAGGGLIGLHAGLASYHHEGPYGSTLRGTFFCHPKEHPEFLVRATGISHPLLSGFSDLQLRDEMYFVRVDSSSTTRLIEAYSPDYGCSTAAWAHECGAGRVFCFTPGHRREVLQNPAYREILARGILWVQHLL